MTYFTPAVNERWDICYYAIRAASFLNVFFGLVPLLTMTAISVDRLFALRLGLRYRQVVTHRRTCITVNGFWILSIVCASTVFRYPSITFMVCIHGFSFVSSHHNLRLHKRFPYSAS